MKKSLILVLCLLLISTCTIFAAHTAVDSKKDNISVKETILSGDKSFAEGLSVTTYAGASGHLFWETTCKLSDINEINSDFRFTHKEEPNFYESKIPYIELNVISDYGIGGIINYDSLNKAMQSVADRTMPSEAHQETINLCDYYEYFPLGVTIDIEGFFYSEDILSEDSEQEKIRDDLNDFFKIPITNPFYQRITVQKDSSDNIVSLDVSTESNSGFGIENISEISDSNCWFTFNLYSYSDASDEENGETNNILDMEQIPGGYGIYCLPFSKDKNNYGAVTIHSEDLRNAYPLDQSTVVKDIHYNEKFHQIVLTTVEKGSFWLTVLDEVTGNELQKIKAMPACQDSSNWLGTYNTFYNDDFAAIMDNDGKFSIIEIHENGIYEQKLVTKPLNELKPLLEESSSSIIKNQLLLDDRTGLLWNGEKLAVSCYLQKNYSQGETGSAYYSEECCDFAVFIINDEKLLYSAIYNSTLDTGNGSPYSSNFSGLNYYDMISPLYSKQITIIQE